MRASLSLSLLSHLTSLPVSEPFFGSKPTPRLERHLQQWLAAVTHGYGMRVVLEKSAQPHREQRCFHKGRRTGVCVCVIILGCVFFSFLYHVLYVTRKTVSRLATTSPIYQLPQTVTLNQPLDCAPSLCKPRKECQLCSAAQASLCDKSEISYSNGNVYF